MQNKQKDIYLNYTDDQTITKEEGTACLKVGDYEGTVTAGSQELSFTLRIIDTMAPASISSGSGSSKSKKKLHQEVALHTVEVLILNFQVVAQTIRVILHLQITIRIQALLILNIRSVTNMLIITNQFGFQSLNCIFYFLFYLYIAIIFFYLRKLL